MASVSTAAMAPMLARLFSELVDGARTPGGAYILNSGDIGLLASLDTLSPADASRSSLGGASIAAHARHVAYGLSLMNEWAERGGNPFADATWDEAWKTTSVDAAAWSAIREDLAAQVRRWHRALATPRQGSEVEVTGMIGSVAHLAYHLGAIRQIDKRARGPKEGTWTS
jgi:hypothetical protein